MENAMRRLTVSLLLALIAAAAPVSAQQRAPASTEGRPPDARFDRSTPQDARRKIEAAGWRNVTELRKGYDGVWHGLAIKDGQRRHVAVTPEGVFPEGD